MSHASGKQVMSGLRTVKRDFSSNTMSSSSQSTDSGGSSRQQKLSAQELRLKLIQDALNGVSSSGDKKNPFSGSSKAGSSGTGSTIGLKRAAPEDSQPGSRKRQLPSSWDSNKDIASYSSTRTLSVSTSVNGASKSTLSVSSSTGSSAKAAPVFLSEEQTHILKLVKNGESLFYTGSAGTGKSVLLREIIKVLRKGKAQDSVAITASTGIAACNIGGVTIHSFAGIGIGVDSVDQLVSRIRKNKKAMSRWLRTKTLIIDEVSMVDGDLFDKLAEIGSKIKKDPRPFGGIQVIVTGDFFQLPPVAKSAAVKFAFEAQYWKQAIKKTFNLTKVFRQKDPEFVDMLNEMRFGRLSSKSIMKFQRLSRPIEYDDGVTATELFPRREDVERSNSTRMRTLNTETHEYTASHGGKLAGSEQGERLLTNFMAPGKLTLKLGAQVMLIKNMDETNVNGSMGTIIEFKEPQNYQTNPDDPFAVNTKPASKSGPQAGGKEKGKSASLIQKWPVVEFTNPRRTMLVQPESWKVELPDGEVQVSRTQLPLILAWAMSIHKSQGQTLERVKVDLARIFEKGQAYVALSRATSLQGLQVLNFDPAKVNAHPKVAEWSKTLETVPI